MSNYKRTVSSRRKWCELMSWLAFRNSGNVFQWSCNPKDRQERQCGHVYNVRTVNINPKAANLTLVSFSMKQSMYKFNGWGDFIICCSWFVSRVDSLNTNCQSFHLHFICMTWRGHHLKWDCVHIRQLSVFVLCLIIVAVRSMTDECYLVIRWSRPIFIIPYSKIITL